jgi:hypothetical protein
MNIFGIDLSEKILGKKKNRNSEITNEKVVSFVTDAEADAGALVIGAAGGWAGHFVDISGSTAGSDKDLIMRYRQAATCAECDTAISDIVDAAIVSPMNGTSVDINLDEVDTTASIKKKVHEEFKTILKLFKFAKNGTDIFRSWYVDGRLFYHILVDTTKPNDGIQGLRKIDPCKIKKVREINTIHDPKSGAHIVQTAAEYFLFSEIAQNTNSTTGVKIDTESIIYTPSGLLDETQKQVVSHLHKALKLVNNLRMLEDALVIYRISRAPERRIFYIDVGNLPKGKSEEYVQGIMSKYRNKLVYDMVTGEIRDERKTMSMLEDFWLPRREGGKGTEITTLPGGENLSQIEDVKFFQQKLYRALNVPVGRLEGENAFSIGRSTEISRDEVKFQKFITKIRKKFSFLLLDALRTQLLLKSIITDDDWKEWKEVIAVEYSEDNYFTQLKEFEILRERVTMLDAIQAHVGKYYSEKWIRKNLLGFDEEDIKIMDAEIADEQEAQAPEDGAPPAGEGEGADAAFAPPADDGRAPDGEGPYNGPLTSKKPTTSNPSITKPTKTKSAKSEAGARLRDAEKQAMKGA